MTNLPNMGWKQQKAYAFYCVQGEGAGCHLGSPIKNVLQGKKTNAFRQLREREVLAANPVLIARAREQLKASGERQRGAARPEEGSNVVAWLQPVHRQGVQRNMRCWDVSACLGSPAIIMTL